MRNTLKEVEQDARHAWLLGIRQVVGLHRSIALYCTLPQNLMICEELLKYVLSTFWGQLQQPALWSFSPVPLRVHVAEIKT